MTLTKTMILSALLLATPAFAADPIRQQDQVQLRDRAREHSQAAAQERSRDRSREMSQARAHEQARSASGMGPGGATGGGAGFRGGR